MKLNKIRGLRLALVVSLLVGILPVVPASAVDYGAVDYLKLGDYVTILPAEENNKPIETTTWAINVQDSGSINGQDIQMWDMGTSVKMVVRRYDSDKHAFALIPTNFRESADQYSSGAKFWDLEGRDTDSGTVIHVWEDDDLNDENKLFFLQDDRDGDPETFYLCSYYVADEGEKAKYLAPRDYSSGYWDDNGRNIVLSSDPFRWRVQVLNRAAKGVSPAWMASLDGDLRLSEINIPGTHDSCTANVEGSWNETLNNIACQKYFIDEQLIAGIRAFDLRYTFLNKSVVMIHGSNTWVCHNKDHGNRKGTDMRLVHVLDDCLSFLEAYPTETIIMTIKQDDGGSEAPARMADIFTELTYNGRPYLDYCYDWSNPSPTLDQVRGKLVIMTRSDPDSLDVSEDQRKYFGPDLSNWNYNDEIYLAQRIYDGSSFFGGAVWVQDDYVSGDGNKKTHVRNVLEQMNVAAGTVASDGETKITADKIPSTKDFVFNYLTKTTSNGGTTPLSAAEVMNDYLLTDENIQAYFTGSTWKRTGITVLDYADKNLAMYIANSNFLPGHYPTVDIGFDFVTPQEELDNAIENMQRQGVMVGVGNGNFAPEMPLTRAMLTQIIYNMRNGSEDIDNPATTFSDVPEDTWYSRAVAWAQAKGMVTILNLTADTFGPEENVTREQLVTMLWRHYGAKESDQSLEAFPDADMVSEFAVPAMKWAVEKNIVLGTDDGTLNPQGSITRGEIAVVLNRFEMTVGDLFQKN